MSEQRPVPEPWAQAYIAVNAVDGRTTDGTPIASFNALRNMCRVHPTTLARIAYKELRKGPRQETINKIAGALHLPPSQVSAWAGTEQSVSAPYQAPAAADRLTKRQREAVDELILSIVEATAARAAPTDNVRVLHPPKQPVDVDGLAARTVVNSQTEQREAEWAERGQESQETGSDEPL